AKNDVQVVGRLCQTPTQRRRSETAGTVSTCAREISTKSKRSRGNQQAENTPCPLKEFLKRWDPNAVRSICQNVNPSISSGIECLGENATSLTTLTQPNGNCTWSFPAKAPFAIETAGLKSWLATRSSLVPTNRIN